MTSDASSSTPWRFTLLQLFYGMAVLGPIAAYYGEHGVDGFIFSICFWPLALIGYGLFWKAKRTLLSGIVFQIGMLLPIVAVLGLIEEREIARQKSCGFGMMQLGFGLLSYLDSHGTLRPTDVYDSKGERTLSWRVELVARMDRLDVRDAFSQAGDPAWNSPAGRGLLAKFSPFVSYRCPAADRSANLSYTHFTAIVGERTAWGTDRPLKPIDIPDGLSNTILLGENGNSDIEWTEPRDLNYDDMSMTINDSKQTCISSDHGEIVEYFDGSRKFKRTGAHVLMADGSVRYLTNDTDPEVLRSLILRDDGRSK